MDIAGKCGPIVLLHAPWLSRTFPPHFCLRQLDGRQRTDELEAVVRRGLEVCEQAIAAVRTLQKTMPACSERADQMREFDTPHLRGGR